MSAGEAERGGDPGRRPRTVQGPWWYRRSKKKLDPERRREILNDLFFEGADRGPFLRRFSVLLALSILIATFGLSLDSTAVVIGAMLVAPLMTPIIALAASFVMGWPRRQLESVATVVIASAGAIALAWLTLKLIPEAESRTLASKQLLARTEPTMLDTAVAVAAGAAGAYVLVRREALAALPGVAVAVALVPPLATIGMTLELGDGKATEGALLLYLTNLTGIVVAAFVVLLLTGFNPLERRRLPARTRVGIASAVVVFLAVAYPLQQISSETVREALDEDDAARVARGWIGDRDLHISDVEAEGDAIVMDLIGADRPPPVELLAEDLSRDLGHDVEITVRWTRRREATATASG